MTKRGAGAAKPATLKRRTFTREFKLQVIREVEADKTQAQVARDYQLSDNTISKWRRELRKYKERAFAGRGHAYTDEALFSSRGVEQLVQPITPGGFESYFSYRVELFKEVRPGHPDFTRRMTEIRRKVDVEVLGAWDVQK